MREFGEVSGPDGGRCRENNLLLGNESFIHINVIRLSAELPPHAQDRNSANSRMPSRRIAIREFPKFREFPNVFAQDRDFANS